MDITIYKSFVKTAMEEDQFGHAPSGYWALTADGKGKAIARVTGVDQLRDGDWAQEAYIGAYVNERTGETGAWFTIPQTYSFAKRGMYGLEVA